jgi:Asp-tRNA(Asn)/Glu-tRNA(Gln) amidotransferase C subunit
MAELTKEQVYELARLAGLEMDDQRAETISSRLGAVLEELDEIPPDALAAVEPALTFAVQHVETPAGGAIPMQSGQNQEAQNA